MDAIFKALADPTRRALLDALRRKDGQTLGELTGAAEMTRFGVMKHLAQLEEAHLVTSVRKGRFKYHYLNGLPLQEAIDRWIEPLIAKPVARGILTLKSELEKETTMRDAAKPDLVMHTYIDCAHDALWDALTRGDLMAKYHFASGRITGDYAAPGDAVKLLRDDDSTMLTQELIALDPKSRIETSFLPGWVDAAETSRCVFLLEPADPGMKLTIEHYRLGAGTGHVHDGWTRFMAGLKTWLETGRTQRFAPMEATA